MVSWDIPTEVCTYIIWSKNTTRSKSTFNVKKTFHILSNAISPIWLLDPQKKSCYRFDQNFSSILLDTCTKWLVYLYIRLHRLPKRLEFLFLSFWSFLYSFSVVIDHNNISAASWASCKLKGSSLIYTVHNIFGQQMLSSGFFCFFRSLFFKTCGRNSRVIHQLITIYCIFR